MSHSSPSPPSPSLPDDWLKTLAPQPRLLADEARFAALRAQLATDDTTRLLLARLRDRADAIRNESPVVLQPDAAGNVLPLARRAQERVLTTALVYRLTDEPVYARRAIREMLHVASLPTWPTKHYLDVAEFTFGLAVGLDWLHAELSAAERAQIKDAIVEKGLRPSFDGDPRHRWWLWADNNWNQVCHASLAVGALAVAERAPDLARQIIERALANIAIPAATYAPDGAYPEGFNYWGYGTGFHVLLVDALRHSLGHEFGLADFPGFLASARYVAQMTTPTGRYFNYADSYPDAVIQLIPTLFWFARRLGDPFLLSGQLDGLRHQPANPFIHAADQERHFALALLWWEPALADSTHTPRPPLHWAGNGITPVAVHRSAWDDPLATFVGLKGGSPGANHGHMDVGSFVLEADGVRWALDLGAAGSALTPPPAADGTATPPPGADSATVC
jgi:hypothetical protein